MTPSPREVTRLHTRLLKCALEAEDSRAYWARTDGSTRVSPQRAFEDYWFGARSLGRVEVLLANMRERYDAFPAALAVLHRWRAMPPDTRRVICHWHVQLADPLYRAFTGAYLAQRRARARADVTRDLVVQWVESQGPGRWTMSTRIQFASKLLSTAFAAGLVAARRDPRPVVTPRVPDDALAYLLYLLRAVQHGGTLLANPYLASVGLTDTLLDDRLRDLPGVTFQRQADLLDLGWRYPDLSAWADATVAPPAATHVGGAPP